MDETKVILRGQLSLSTTLFTKTSGAAPLVVETNTSDREGVREVFLSQGFDNDTMMLTF